MPTNSLSLFLSLITLSHTPPVSRFPYSAASYKRDTPPYTDETPPKSQLPTPNSQFLTPLFTCPLSLSLLYFVFGSLRYIIFQSIMSTDLEFPHGLPVIRLQPAVEEVQTRPPSTEEPKKDDGNNNEAIQNSVNLGDHGGDEAHNEEDECRTPKSDDHKIPMIRSCPPAPRKQRRVFLCKRKLSHDLQFFENTGRDEIDSFFRSCFNVKKGRH